MKQFKIDLNSDLGEAFGNYSLGMDQDILAYVTSANVACGFHAGDPLVMDKTVALAAKKGVAIGAHPGFPDLQGFGRRNMACTPSEVKSYIQYQLGALQAFCTAQGQCLQHVKPHGALYNMAAKDKALALAIAEAVKAVAPKAILLGLAGSEMLKAGRQLGLRVASEVFADRAYQADGSLVPRSQKGAVIHNVDLVLERTLKMVQQGTVTAITGEEVPLEAHSICVHGDNPQAVEFVARLKAYLEAHGVELAPLSHIV